MKSRECDLRSNTLLPHRPPAPPPTHTRRNLEYGNLQFCVLVAGSGAEHNKYTSTRPETVNVPKPLVAPMPLLVNQWGLTSDSSFVTSDSACRTSINIELRDSLFGTNISESSCCFSRACGSATTPLSYRCICCTSVVTLGAEGCQRTASLRKLRCRHMHLRVPAHAVDGQPLLPRHLGVAWPAWLLAPRQSLPWPAWPT